MLNAVKRFYPFYVFHHVGEIVFYPFGKTYKISLICPLLSVRLLVTFFIRFSMNIDSGNAPHYLVGSSGLEPPTSRLSGARSNHLSYEPIQFSVAALHLVSTGGEDGNRTHDPLLAGQVLSQLSYTPLPGQ